MTSFRTRQIIRKAQLGLKDDILPTDDLWLCTTCYSCVERCPREVEITDIMIIMRNMAVKKGYMADQHKKIGASMMKTATTVPLPDDIKALRVKMGLPAGTADGDRGPEGPGGLQDRHAQDRFRQADRRCLNVWKVRILPRLRRAAEIPRYREGHP